MPIHIDRAINDLSLEAGSAEAEALDARWQQLDELAALMQAREENSARLAAENFDD